jgi:hypothetical protein
MARELIPLALALFGACHRDSPTAAEAAAASPATTPLAAKPFYRVDRAPQAACASGAICEAALVLTALGNYHVNKDYPFKFVGDPAAAIQVDGQGTFAFGDARHGTMTIKFRAASSGTATLVGTFKLSVCSDENCEIETPKLELLVPVS